MAFPTDHDWREYTVYIRGPAGLNTYAFATRDDYRSGVQHLGQIRVIPAPTDAASNDFGLQAAGSFELEVSDEPTDDDWPITDQTGEFLLQQDGTAQLVQNY